MLRRVASCYTCLYGIRAKAPCRPGKSGPDSADLNGQRQTTLRSSRKKNEKISKVKIEINQDGELESYFEQF